MSRRALGLILGVSETAVRKAIKAGHVTVLADGTIDPDAARADWASKTDPARSKVKAAPARRAAEGTGPSVRTEADARAAVTLIRRVLQEEGAAAARVPDFDMARLAETILKARERDLKMQLASGKLVDAETVQRVVLNLARGERDALVNWPARVAPLIAAELGIDQVALSVAMEKHVREYLAERSEPTELRLAS